MNINRKLDFRLVPATGIAAGKGYRADIGNVLSLPRAHPRGSFVFSVYKLAMEQDYRT